MSNRNDALRALLAAWPYINCVCGRSHKRIPDDAREAIAALATNASLDEAGTQHQANPHIGSSLDDFMREEGIASQPQESGESEAAGAGGGAVTGEMVREAERAISARLGFFHPNMRFAARDALIAGNAATPAPAVAQDERGEASGARAVEDGELRAVVRSEPLGAPEDYGLWLIRCMRRAIALAARPSAAPGPSAGEVNVTRNVIPAGMTREQAIAHAGKVARDRADARQSQGAAVDAAEFQKMADDMIRTGTGFMRDGKRVDPADVFAAREGAEQATDGSEA